MLTAKTLPAIVIKLGKGEVAVFIGSESWNGLTEYICIAPVPLAGGKMVTADKGPGHHFTEIFAKIAGLEAEPLEVVIASPQIEKALREAEAAFVAKDQAKESAEHPNT
jgi:hypothetical protein